uniref:Fibronectin type-III domain-containing protein n=1 Tax=Setaria digitata TaxID=48799 RepID=A0A915PK83_9BILA
MVPAMQYRFMVTAVGPGGRLGGPIMSNWAQSLTADGKLRTPVGPLMITTQYSNENGLCALVKWYHSPYHRQSMSDNPDGGEALFGNCHYKIMDNGNGILLSNLQFSTEYSVAVRSLSSIGTSSVMHQTNIEEMSGMLERKFLTPACNEVFGSGSLECAPEPVKNLEALVNPNGSVKIQWIPSSEPNDILVYQLLYQSLTNHHDCDKDLSSTYINAVS